MSVPPLAIEARPSPVPAEATRHARRNTLALGADISTFGLGLAFASPTTLIPAFAERLGAPNIVIGAIPAIMTVGWMLPSVLVANHTQGLTRKVPFIVRWTIFERLPYLVLGLAAMWLAPSSPTATLVLLMAMLILGASTGGFLMPAWLDLIGRVVPIQARGRFFAVASSVSAVLGLAGASAVAWILAREGYPVGYGWCFLIGFVWMMVSFVCLVLVREPPSATPGPRRAIFAYLRHLPGVLRGNPNLARFIMARALSVSGTMANGFLAVHALRNLGASDGEVGIFTSLILAAQIVGTLAFGWLADRGGHLRVLALGSFATGLAAATALLASGVAALYVAFLCSGVGLAATQVSAMAIGMEFGPEDERPTYIALNNSSIAPFALVAPLIGGLIVDLLGFSALFVVSAAFGGLGALALLRGVRDPRRLSQAGA